MSDLLAHLPFLLLSGQLIQQPGGFGLHSENRVDLCVEVFHLSVLLVVQLPDTLKLLFEGVYQLCVDRLLSLQLDQLGVCLDHFVTEWLCCFVDVVVVADC